MVLQQLLRNIFSSATICTDVHGTYFRRCSRLHVVTLPAYIVAGVTLNFYLPLRNEPVLFSILKNEPKQLNNVPFH